MIKWPFRVSPQTLARHYPPDWDLAYNQPGDLPPRVDELLAGRIDPNARVLDFGAGATPNWQRKKMCRRLVGVDVDPAVLRNPALHERALIGSDGIIPYPSESFDGAIAHWVFEHLDNPAKPLAEISRVLKIGAPLVFITLNRRNWMCAISQCLPPQLSCVIAEKLGQEPAGAGRAFPTCYRLNTPHDIARHSRRAGLQIEQLRFFETYPVYLQMLSPLFPAGIALERFFNRRRFMERYRVNIVGVLRRVR